MWDEMAVVTCNQKKISFAFYKQTTWQNGRGSFPSSFFLTFLAFYADACKAVRQLIFERVLASSTRAYTTRLPKM